MGEALRSIIHTSGPSGLLQGFSASALRDAPYAGLFVMSYEFIKEQSCENVNFVHPTAIHSPLSSSLHIGPYFASGKWINTQLLQLVHIGLYP